MVIDAHVIYQLSQPVIPGDDQGRLNAFNLLEQSRFLIFWNGFQKEPVGIIAIPAHFYAVTCMQYVSEVSAKPKVAKKVRDIGNTRAFQFPEDRIFDFYPAVRQQDRREGK